MWGRVVAQGQPVPAPWGQVQNTKRESQIQNGVGESINHGRQGQALLAISHWHPEFSTIQTMKAYDPSGLLTKIKSHVPSEPTVRRQLADQGRSERRWVEMVRDTQAGKRQRGRDTGERQPEAARNNQRG
uniref:Uncharacterized protein n=1 Tax=Myotis myotis TaxID=51298 RepID=A0A7J7SBS9_MYOMY|nr:hypothetical protein mMyoMyo1_009442 [Myotis myotis]